jgi:phosphodiesterase/alkaline phosphatase D-like protein
MCVASCSNYEQGWFTAYRRLAEEHPDLVVHLGDYQYEYAAREGGVRTHIGPETVTLANYRQRYAQYRTDPDLQAAHAAAPWLAVFDDHEVADNWADEVPDKPEPTFLDRRAAALQAYYENMPLRRPSMPRGIDMQLYRRVQWGGLATFHMLDTRQYRDDQPCDEISECGERVDPTRSLTGAEQERWLLNGFAQSQARWDVLGQQVFSGALEVLVVLRCSPVAAPGPPTIGEGADGRIAVVQETRVNAVSVQIWLGVAGFERARAGDVRVEQRVDVDGPTVGVLRPPTGAGDVSAVERRGVVVFHG